MINSFSLKTPRDSFRDISSSCSFHSIFSTPIRVLVYSFELVVVVESLTWHHNSDVHCIHEALWILIISITAHVKQREVVSLFDVYFSSISLACSNKFINDHFIESFTEKVLPRNVFLPKAAVLAADSGPYIFPRWYWGIVNQNDK